MTRCKSWGKPGALPLARSLLLFSAFFLLSVVKGRERVKESVGVEGDVYAFGYNTYGQLGLGDGLYGDDPRYANEPAEQPEEYLTPQLIRSIAKVERLYPGGYHVLAVIGGRLHTWGWNAYGQLGRLANKQTYGRPPRESQDNLPRVVEHLAEEEVDLAVAGIYHNVVLTKSGRLLSFGHNANGQLCQGHYDDVERPSPLLVEGGGALPSPVRDVYAGADHTMIILDNYQVYGCGSNKFGQLAMEDGINTLRTKLVLLPALSSLKLGRTYVGPYHGFAFAADMQAYAWGYNGMGQLCDGSIAPAYQPRHIPALSEGPLNHTSVDHIYIGTVHTIVVPNFGGGVVGCGDNSHGQLGTGDIRSQTLPVHANLSTIEDGAVRTARSAGFHTLMLTHDKQGGGGRVEPGLLFGMGSNEFGQLGIGILGTNFYDVSQYDPGRDELDAVVQPTLVEVLPGFNITEIYVGLTASYVKLGQCPFQNIDACGVCMGDNTTCYGCDGIPGSNVVVDVCGVCGGDSSTCAGCDGVPFSGTVVDQCGVCGGNGTECVDCNGDLYGTAQLDVCGVCGGDDSTCKGCDGVPNSGKVFDRCEICGGMDASCLLVLRIMRGSSNKAGAIVAPMW
eukprot:CAMPEP_0113879650 /NCGR_PEP_ID=MMETSP0780_2-20120614/7350_1 /TAXON_ID=652834 /ORGANISM="Palpitomonas bilix" /LENGTH=617 /DNA_ID=CAMNT_0000866243 /DNA_START=312 /DNA_END=2162 /DNA_ORIENTATION=- /assembly_acc=CAM_ASM_000599